MVPSTPQCPSRRRAPWRLEPWTLALAGLLAAGGAVGCSGSATSGPQPAPHAGVGQPTPVATIPPAAPPSGAAGSQPGPAPTTRTDPSGPPPPPPTAAGKPGPFRCHLPEPKLSEDPCKSDADCGVSAPCHAPACVALAKSKPAGPDTMCTRMLACNSADANRCGCYQGRCALIPPGY